MSSWWAAIHGYRHPRSTPRCAPARAHDARDVRRADARARRGLCERLVALAPAPLTRVFLCDSGSVAVEVAIKLAIQYWHARGQPRRKRAARARGGYHGDTMGAMAVCDPVTGMHGLFRGA